MEKIILFCFLCFGGQAAASATNPIYGRESLRGMRGVQVFVHCAGDGDIKKIEDDIKSILEKRLQKMSVPIIIYSENENSGALKLLLTSVKTDNSNGSYYIYASLQLHQKAYLAASHNFMDCSTWDIWKMGIFNKEQIMLEAEDLAREFANDFISANVF